MILEELETTFKKVVKLLGLQIHLLLNDSHVLFILLLVTCNLA